MNAAAQKAARERLDSLSPGPWCSTYVYTQIRHVDRNCQLECTVHPDGQNCLSFGRYDGDTIAVLPTDLRAALDALERVRALADEWDASTDAALVHCAEETRAALAGSGTEDATCAGDCDEGYGMCDECVAAGRCPLQHSEDGPRKCPRCERPAAEGGVEGSGDVRRG